MPLKSSELRKDYIQEKYVIIAPRRGKRPHDVAKPRERNKKMVTSCIFCPENIKSVSSLYQYGDKQDWKIKIIKNKYPAVTLQNKKAYGQQEVVIETPDHVDEIEDLPVNHITELLKAYKIRTEKISKNKKIDYILNGEEHEVNVEYTLKQV